MKCAFCFSFGTLKYKILFVVVWREKEIANREGGNEREREKKKWEKENKKGKKGRQQIFIYERHEKELRQGRVVVVLASAVDAKRR